MIFRIDRSERILPILDYLFIAFYNYYYVISTLTYYYYF
jgi:hypothetical protein